MFEAKEKKVGIEDDKYRQILLTLARIQIRIGEEKDRTDAFEQLKLLKKYYSDISVDNESLCDGGYEALNVELEIAKHYETMGDLDNAESIYRSGYDCLKGNNKSTHRYKRNMFILNQQVSLSLPIVLEKMGGDKRKEAEKIMETLYYQEYKLEECHKGFYYLSAGLALAQFWNRNSGTEKRLEGEKLLRQLRAKTNRMKGKIGLHDINT